MAQKLRFRTRISRMLRQEVIPSQGLPSLVPYSNRVQRDIIQQRPLRGRKPDGYTRPEPWVLTQFAARPINCIDFISTFTAAEQAALSATQSALFTINVDPQRTFIVRELQLSMWFNVVATPVFNATSGAPQMQVSAQFLLNGGAVDRAGKFRVDAAACNATITNRLVLPFYILAPPNSSLQLSLSFTTPADATFAFVQPFISGNALLNEGVNPTSEPGTKCAVPIWGADRREQPTVLRPVGYGKS